MSSSIKQWNCNVCNNIISGKALSLFNNYYHNTCFKCNKCNISLEGKQCLNISNKITCIPCGSPKCAKCLKPVYTGGLNAIRKIWHKECFVCTQCNNDFSNNNGQFLVLNNLPYCLLCGSKPLKEQKKIEKCFNCNNPLLENENILYAFNNGYHETCFTCIFCNSLLIEGKFIPVNEKPSCNACAINKLASKCRGCFKPIVGTTVNVLDYSWHPECLKCHQCHEIITNYEKIYKKDEEIVCPGCVQSVFNMVVVSDNLSSPTRPLSPQRQQSSSPQRTLSPQRQQSPIISKSPNRNSFRFSSSQRNIKSKPRHSIRFSKISSNEKRKTQLPIRTTKNMDEILSSMENILSDYRSVNALLEYMVSDYSVENLLFYLDAIQFKELELNEHDIKIYAKSIWNKYFINGGDMEIYVDAPIRRNLEKKMKNPESLMFEEASNMVVREMKNCTYPRFIKSDEVLQLRNAF